MPLPLLTLGPLSLLLLAPGQTTSAASPANLSRTHGFSFRIFDYPLSAPCVPCVSGCQGRQLVILLVIRAKYPETKSQEGRLE